LKHLCRIFITLVVDIIFACLPDPLHRVLPEQ
jgi:hypothetical protein